MKTFLCKRIAFEEFSETTGNHCVTLFCFEVDSFIQVNDLEQLICENYRRREKAKLKTQIFKYQAMCSLSHAIISDL